MEYIFSKHFTVEEANALVPGLRQLFLTVHEMIASAPNDSDMARQMFMNPNSATPVTSRSEAYDVGEKLLTEVQELGIVIQDWKRGLIDFPHLRDGHEVYLCYEIEDGNTIQHFHEIDAGYAGRQPL